MESACTLNAEHPTPSSVPPAGHPGKLPSDARRALLFYNALFPLVLLALLPGFLLRMLRRGKYRHKFGQRFGIYSSRVRQRLAGKQPVWIHAVSVGEVLVALKLANQLKELDPALRVVLSTTTSTGFALARGQGCEWIETIYNPLDFPPVVRRAFDAIQPRQLVLVEAEVWPNLVAQAKRRGLPVTLVNARLSPRSERRFRRARWLTGPIFRMLDTICAQEPEDTARWVSLGVDAARIRHTGSIKFDQTDTAASRADEFRAIVEKLGVRGDAPVLLAGSTFPGEEKIVAEIFCELREEFRDLFLILVPRHVERTPEVIAELRPLDLNIALRTELGDAHGAEADCLIVDTTGELRDWYPIASIVFIGKSLTGEGGQNPVEAVVAGKPVLFGPHMENFAAVVRHLLAHGAATQVAGAAELKTQIERLMRDPLLRKQAAACAHKAVAMHQGATGRSARIVAHFSA